MTSHFFQECVEYANKISSNFSQHVGLKWASIDSIFQDSQKYLKNLKSERKKKIVK